MIFFTFGKFLDRSFLFASQENLPGGTVSPRFVHHLVSLAEERSEKETSDEESNVDYSCFKWKGRSLFALQEGRAEILDESS